MRRRVGEQAGGAAPCRNTRCRPRSAPVRGSGLLLRHPWQTREHPLPVPMGGQGPGGICPGREAGPLRPVCAGASQHLVVGPPVRPPDTRPRPEGGRSRHGARGHVPVPRRPGRDNSALLLARPSDGGPAGIVPPLCPAGIAISDLRPWPAGRRLGPAGLGPAAGQGGRAD